MKTLIRSLLIVAISSLALIGCGDKKSPDNSSQYGRYVMQNGYCYDTQTRMYVQDTQLCYQNQNQNGRYISVDGYCYDTQMRQYVSTQYCTSGTTPNSGAYENCVNKTYRTLNGSSIYCSLGIVGDYNLCSGMQVYNQTGQIVTCL